MEINEIKSIGISAFLVALNIGLMMVFSLTALASIVGIAFRYPIVGILVYGAMLTIGTAMAKKGVRKSNFGMAIGGASLLQFAYGTFGAGILAFLSIGAQATVLGITAAVTTIIAIAAGLLVYGTGKDFSSWRKYASYLFLGVIGFGFIGTAVPGLIIIAFVLALLGFLVYLVYEIWDMKRSPENVYLNGIGIYVAFMGVFVHILRIVIELMARR